MTSHSDKTQENKSQSVASTVSQKQSRTNSSSQFIDNRPEVTLQRKYQEMADNSAHSTHAVQLQAHTFAQGLGSGQEKHSPQEAWHGLQQKQVRVKPTIQMKGNINVDDDKVISLVEKSVFGLNTEDFASQEDFQERERKRLGPKFTLPHTLAKYNWNWFNLKDDLAYKKNGQSDEEYNTNLNKMRQLVGYRNTLVNDLLKEVIEEIEGRHEDIEDFDIEAQNFGSTTPTSDIDITFVSDSNPELEFEAVELFNKKFIQKYGITPGVMLDTNVYTSGFMPNEEGFKDKFKTQTAEEKLLIEDSKVQKHRIQLALSYLSILQYFNTSKKGKGKWFLFKHRTKKVLAEYLRNKITSENLDSSTEDTLVILALDDVQAIFEKAEDLYQETSIAISNEKALQILPSKVKSAIKKDNESESLHLETMAKDKLYVKSLKRVANLLKLLQENGALLEANQDLYKEESIDNFKSDREDKIKERAKLIIEFEKEQGKALIYANEAYFSGGSAYHVVKGMQGGQGININRQQKMQSLLMNIGYKLQHFQHKAHENLGRAMIDTSKYGQRVADLALIQNLNIQSTELEIFDTLSVQAKEMLVNEIEIVTQYKKGETSPNTGESILTPSSKESAAQEDFEMTQENVELNFLEIAHKTIAPYYWDKFKSKGRIWSNQRTGYHFR
ncbi:hypothetical protein [Urechidicola croceus]|uniref:Uncharacterized protein n=1 Tax=Urechidicola croceus TaxID=1850246 RepID=A0A1D8P6I2_9FLAO|nr:hypothetical protein [Urechidicola croceus]AOW20147.1 hypothetical protein LPB138_05385 [Urechidicola croceus]